MTLVACGEDEKLAQQKRERERQEMQRTIMLQQMALEMQRQQMQQRQWQAPPPQQQQVLVVCPTCRGTGKDYSGGGYYDRAGWIECKFCNGQGTIVAGQGRRSGW